MLITKTNTYLFVARSLFYSPGTATTKYHRLGGLNNSNILLTVPETGKSEIPALAESASGEDWLPDLPAATLSLSLRLHTLRKEQALVSPTPLIGAPALAG